MQTSVHYRNVFSAQLMSISMTVMDVILVNVSCDMSVYCATCKKKKKGMKNVLNPLTPIVISRY